MVTMLHTTARLTFDDFLIEMPRSTPAFIEPAGGFCTGFSLNDALATGGGLLTSAASSFPVTANEKFAYSPSMSSGNASYLRKGKTRKRGTEREGSTQTQTQMQTQRVSAIVLGGVE